MKKIESHLETYSSDSQRINLTIVAYSFVANFVSYISAKYYLNWFSFHIVIMKVIGVNFFLKHSVEMSITPGTGGPKTSNFRRDSGQLRYLIASIPGTPEVHCLDLSQLLLSSFGNRYLQIPITSVYARTYFCILWSTNGEK